MQHYYVLFVRHVEMITLDICNGSKFQLRKLRSRNNDIAFQLIKYQKLAAQLAIECFQKPQNSAL
jgi:hypothetical protein